MGTKLCNINFYNPEGKSYNLASGYSIAHIADGWDTIFEDEAECDFKKLAKVARDISKETGDPVVNVEYFDDDIFELNVTKDGKKVGYHYVTHGRTISKKLPELISALKLDAKDSTAFKYIAKNEQDPGAAIDKLAAICGLPFYADRTIYEDVQEGLIPDKAPVLEAIKKEKAKNKIKSTPAELLSEFTGLISTHMGSSYDEDVLNGVIRVIEPSLKGVDYSNVNCYQLITGDEPSLKNVFSVKYPFDVLAPDEDPRYLQIYVDFTGRLTIMDPGSLCHYETTNPSEIEKFVAMGRVPAENLNKMEFEIGDVTEKVKSKSLPDEPNPELEKKYSDAFTSFFWQNNWENKIKDGLIIRLGQYSVDEAEKQDYARVDFFSSNREFQRTVLIPIDWFQEFYAVHNDYAYIEEKQQIIQGDIVLDLEKKTMTHNELLPDKSRFIDKRITKEGKKILVIDAGKYIHIYDYDFNRLESYAIKGKVERHFYDDKGNLYLITSTNIHGWDYYTLKDSDKIRLYRINIG